MHNTDMPLREKALSGNLIGHVRCSVLIIQ